MSSNYKKTIVLGMDYSQFSGGITECNRKMGLLDAEFKLAKEQAKNYGSEVDQLKIKKEALSQKINLQTKIVQEHSKAYDKAMSSGQATEKQIDALDKTLLTARTTLEKLNGEYDAANKELEKYAKTNERAGSQVDKADKSNKTFGDTIRGIASSLGVEVNPMVESFAAKFDGVDEKVGLAVMTLGTLATVLTDCSLSTAKYADDILTMSSVTGLGTDTLQKMNYTSELLDVSTEQITGSMTKMIRTMSDARDGNKDLQKAYAQLGVQYKDGNGELKNAETVFYDVIDALGKMTNETERDAKAMEIFGRSARELNPLIEAGSKKFREFGKEAESIGFIMDDVALQKMGALDDAMQRLDNTGESLKINFGLTLAPVLTALFDVLAKVPVPVLQSLTTLAGAVAGIVLVVKALKEVTNVGKGVIDFFTGFDAKAVTTTAKVMGVVVALIVLGAILASIMGKSNDLQQSMKAVGDSVSSINGAVQNAQNKTQYNAYGTDYFRGGETWISEHGPERVTLPRGSKIEPVGKADYNRGDTHIYNITIDSKNVSEFTRIIDLANGQRMAGRRGAVRI